MVVAQICRQLDALREGEGLKFESPVSSFIVPSPLSLSSRQHDDVSERIFFDVSAFTAESDSARSIRSKKSSSDDAMYKHSS